MDANELGLLLARPEGPTLEFKRSWYPIDAQDSRAKARSRGELIKDVLALANGSPSTAGDTAYIVIGASDEVDDEGRRQLFDAIDFEPAGLGRRILQMVSSASTPVLTDVLFDVITLDSKRLGVITIHPTAHLHETTRALVCSESTYTERTVFLRAGDCTAVATSDDRDAVRRHKRHRSKEFGRVSPVAFGASLGSLLGAMSGLSLARQSATTAPARFASLAAGLVVFGLVGLGVGWATSQYLEMRRDWYRVPEWLRWASAALGVVLAGWLLFIFYQQLL